MLSTKKAAEALGVTDSRVRQMIRAGKLKALRVGRAWIIKEGNLEAALFERAEQRVDNSPALRPHLKAIFADWNEAEHLRWVATAPISEIVDWAEAQS